MNLHPISIVLIDNGGTASVSSLLRAVRRRQSNGSICIINIAGINGSAIVGRVVHTTANGGRSIVAASRFPNAALSRVHVPLSSKRFLVSAPKVVRRRRVTRILDPGRLGLMTPRRRVGPVACRLGPRRALFLNNTSHFSFVDKRGSSFAYCFTGSLGVRHAGLRGTSRFCTGRLNALLRPPSTRSTRGFPPLIEHRFGIGMPSSVMFSKLK